MTKLIVLVFTLLLGLTRAHLEAPQFFSITTTGHVAPYPGNVRPSSWSNQTVAYARYLNRINQTGWAELEVVSNPSQPDATQAYFAGFLEGHLTHSLIHSYRRNGKQGPLFDHSTAECQNIASGFIADNLKHTIDMVQNHGQKDKYWSQVGLVLYQISGLDDGARSAGGGEPTPNPAPHLSIDPCGTFQMNLDTEYEDLQLIARHAINLDRLTHCSALIKYFPDRSDVLVAHNTWSSYKHMLRLLKKYTLPFSSSTATSISMSSYPGQIFSHDDYYLTSTGLAILETSLNTFNASIWANIHPNSIVLEFIRNTVANRLASNGSDWASIYSQANSGTYGNQWMIVDYGQINSTSGLLTVLEQLPHLIHWEDKTEHLLKHGYWASYNIPYFEDIYQSAGYPEMLATRGRHYSYTETPRARIFARDQPKVANMTTLFSLMRYNDYQNDPLSRCNCSPPYSADYAIASRGDLNRLDGHFPFLSIGFHESGATDAKMTSKTLAEDLEFVAVSGPTDQGQPPFNWNYFIDKATPHYDQPTVWKFKPIITKWRNSSKFPQFKFDF